MRTRSLFLRIGLLAALLSATAWLLVAPAPLPLGISVQREMGFVGHIGIFGILTFTFGATFPCAKWWAAAVLLIMAVLLEAVQVFVPRRDADLADFAMNCLGILLGLITFLAGVVLTTGIHRKTVQKT